jgi:hypothetical protein
MLQEGLRVSRTVEERVVERGMLPHRLHHRFVVFEYQLVAVLAHIAQRGRDVRHDGPEGSGVIAAVCKLPRDAVKPAGQRLLEVSVAGERLPVLQVAAEELLQGRTVLTRYGRCEAAAHTVEEREGGRP